MSHALVLLEQVAAEALKDKIARLAKRVEYLTVVSEEQHARAIQAESSLAIANARIEQLAAAINGRGDTGILTVGILRNWSRDKRHTFCLHLLGSEWLRSTIETAKRDAFRDAVDHIQKQHGIHTTTHCCDVIRALMPKERV